MRAAFQIALGAAAAALATNAGATSLHYYLRSCVREMVLAARTMGKTSLREFGPDDLAALDPIYAGMAGVAYADTSDASAGRSLR